MLRACEAFTQSKDPYKFVPHRAPQGIPAIAAFALNFIGYNNYIILHSPTVTP
jgi:hypothetical protein